MEVYVKHIRKMNDEPDGILGAMGFEILYTGSANPSLARDGLGKELC